MNEGTKGRRDEGTKGRRDEGTKGRRDEGTKGRRDEGTKNSFHYFTPLITPFGILFICSTIWLF